jgi:hypothetical protein
VPASACADSALSTEIGALTPKLPRRKEFGERDEDCGKDEAAARLAPRRDLGECRRLLAHLSELCALTPQPHFTRDR